MKSRVVVWAVVGILAAAAVIFFVVTTRKPPDVNITLDRIAEYSVRVNERLGRLEAEINQAKSALPAGTGTGQVAEAERLVNEARTRLEETRSAQNVKHAYAKLQQAQDAMRDARRVMGRLSRRPPTSSRI